MKRSTIVEVLSFKFKNGIPRHIRAAAIRCIDCQDCWELEELLGQMITPELINEAKEYVISRHLAEAAKFTDWDGD